MVAKGDYLTYVRISRTDFCEAQPILYPRAQLPRMHSVQAVRNGGGIRVRLRDPDELHAWG